VTRDADHPDDAAVASRLGSAPLELVGQFADASNATLLVRLRDRDPRTIGDITAELGHQPAVEDLDPGDLAVYKPRRGEAPLWDFPTGTLHLREIAAYEVSAALGWGLVPVTIRRDDAPFGPGSLQRFVPHDPQQHYFWLLEQGDSEVAAQLQAMVVFDLLIDNADRKGGHVLLEQPAGDTPPDHDRPRIRLVDHGVSFAAEPKLRTVGWHFAGAPVPARLREDVGGLAARFGAGLEQRLAALLAADELAAFTARLRALPDLAQFPEPQGPRPFPWPLL
jgi:uncharacterized repeat protein (TIGR03843 family)